MADLNLNVTDTLKLGLSDAIPALAKTTPATLVEYLVAGEWIFPSGYDIGPVAGNGITMTERSLADRWVGVLAGNNFILNGHGVPGSSPNLSMTVANGVSFLAGRYINMPSTLITCSPSTVNYVFLKVTRDANGDVTGAWIEVNTTGTPPADATPIATATASGVAITSTTDERLLGPHGVIAITSGTSWVVRAGISRAFVEVIGASGGGGGGGGDGGGNTAGGDGTAGGTTSFGALTANGGGAGQGGRAGSTTSNGAQGGSHGTASGGTANHTGRGFPGGVGGQGGSDPAASPSPGADGTDGGNGGYCAGYLNFTVAQSIAIAIGAAGSAGSAGGGGGATGAAGRAGLAGQILVHY